MMINYTIILVFLIIIGVLYLFIKEIFPVDVTAILVMVTLMVLGLVNTHEGVSGFSNEAVITILAMFILSAGIEKTGLIHSLSIRIFGLTGSNEILQLLFIMLFVAPISSIMNNAPIVAIMIPFVLNLTKMSKTRPSKLLIPLSYVSMAAGKLTLIGTSTNLLAASIIARLGMEPFGMFSFWKIGLAVMTISIVYFLTIGYWILPKKGAAKGEDVYKDLKFTSELIILEKSKLVGKKIKDTILRKKYKLKILNLHRDKKIWKENFSNRVLQPGDILTIESVRDTLFNLEAEAGVKIVIEEMGKANGESETLNMIVPQGSYYIGKKIEDLGLKKNAVVMAIRKGTKKITKRLDKIKLHLGDLLLLKTPKEKSEKVRNDRNLILIDELEVNYRKHKRLIAIAILAGVVLLAAFGIYPIMLTALVGVVLMILTGVITTKEAYSSVRWEIIFLLAGLIPLGIALEKSGAAAFIAGLLSKIAVNFPPLWVMIGFYIFTTLLTEILSNNASVILLVPIGIDLARQIGIDPYLMVLVIMFSASTSYLTPVGYKTNTMVYGTGVYKFSDFFRVGVILNIILAFVAPHLIWFLWGGV